MEAMQMISLFLVMGKANYKILGQDFLKSKEIYGRRILVPCVQQTGRIP